MAKTAKTNGRPAPAPAPEVEPQEVALVLAEQKVLQPWFKSLPTWWRTAKRMTVDAIALRTEVQALKVPTTEAADLELQERILDTRNRIRLAEEHWEPYTSMFFKLHRRLTSARTAATKPLEDADALLQGLHNVYVREQRRLAEEADRREQERLQKEADERRARELAELEARAVAAEEASAELSARELVFVEYVAKGVAPLQAATIAKFADPLKSAARLMSLGKVTSAINGLKDAAAIRRQSEAVAASPAIPDRPVMPTRTAVSKVPGIRTKTTWGVTITDREALHQAALRGEVPPDVLVVDEARVRKYAEDMHELIDSWPGCKHTRRETTF